MASEPDPTRLSLAGFLNHIRHTLDGSLQRWEFYEGPEPIGRGGYFVNVLFLGTDRLCQISYGVYVGWLAVSIGDIDKTDEHLTARLNGLVRDDLGNMVPRRPGAEVLSSSTNQEAS